MSWRTVLLLPWVLVAPPFALAENISHVARPGDTPVALAKTYRVSVAAILAHNKGLDPCRIKVGDVILVPANPDTPAAAPATGDPPSAPKAAPLPNAAALPDEEAPGLRYVVLPGDFPATIAERFGIPLDVLSRANPGLDPKNLAVGRVLTIPDGSSCPPPPVSVARPGETATSAPLVMDFQ